MCGRYTLTVTGRLIAEMFELDQVPTLPPRYNIAPTQPVPMVRSGASGGRELVAARWGLIPRWAKDPASGPRLINARAETVATKPAFRDAFRRRRCLIPADGFFEWAATPQGKQPYLIRFADGRPFAFAGLWERWTAPDGEVTESCSIITTLPNRVVAPIHARMPVILDREGRGAWLDGPGGAVSDPAALLAPCPEEGLVAVPVDRRVNNPGVDDPGCIEPIRLYSG